jgi:hypothetical protein
MSGTTAFSLRATATPPRTLPAMSLIAATVFVAIAAAVLAAGAIVTAVFAILAYLNQKQELSHLLEESAREASTAAGLGLPVCSPAYHPIHHV